MARGLICQAISAGSMVARLGLGVGKVAFNTALLPPEIAVKGISALKGEVNGVVDKADKSLQDVGRKCSM